MKYLHSWLQEYIEDALPTGKAFVENVSINAFEVEEIEEIKNALNDEVDFVYEIKTLPNRNHDALSHYFMAKELATIFDLRFKEKNENVNFSDKKDLDISIKIQDTKACTRFMSCKIENLKVAPSPDFIKYRLESIGQKSINNIVDITNYVQFSFNKPMHAYDASLISEFLEARYAKEGEVLITLDDRELKLDDKTLVIADAKNVLGLAGIKGGKYSGINENTKDIILESANFNPALVRKTAQKYNLRTDASKRFENELSDQLVEIGMMETVELIKKYATNIEAQTVAGEITDVWPNKENAEKKVFISLTLKDINKKIGIDLNSYEVKNIFERFGFEFAFTENKDTAEGGDEKGESLNDSQVEFVVEAPVERLDLRNKDDVIEEVARVYGLNNIKSVVPEIKNSNGEKKLGRPHKRLYFENKIKNILFKNGFSEVYNYSLRSKGDIEIVKSVAEDKNKLRNNLRDGMQECINKNIFNMPLIDVEEVRVFEFGNCFSLDENGKEKEWRSLAIAIDDGKKNKNYKETLVKVLAEIEKDLGVMNIDFKESKNEKQKENCIEINFDSLIKDIKVKDEDLNYVKIDEAVTNKEVRYQNFPLTPFIVRDIACWTSVETKEESVEKIIRENISSLCKSVKLFDEFEKEFAPLSEFQGGVGGGFIKKKSYGFRLIYQDESRTLTDEEVNKEAEIVYTKLKESGFEVR